MLQGPEALHPKLSVPGPYLRLRFCWVSGLSDFVIYNKCSSVSLFSDFFGFGFSAWGFRLQGASMMQPSAVDDGGALME